MGDPRTDPSAGAPARPAGRAAADHPPPSPDRHPVRPQDRAAVGGPAGRIALRVRDELLAAAAGLAGGRHLGRDPRGAPGPAGRRRKAGLVEVRHRLVQCAGGFWGADTGPNPTDRGKNGTKHHLMVDRAGVPVASRVSAANVHDVRRLLPTVVACPLPAYGTDGHRPRVLYADRAYASGPHETLLRWMGIQPAFARRGTPHGS